MNTADSKMDFFEVGDKTSLICTDPEVGEAVRATLHDLAFKFHIADTAEMAVERIRYNHYDIIVIQEDFAGSTLKTNSVLSSLIPSPMPQRRSSLIVVVGTGFKTLDAMQAFALSVQLVVNTADLPNFTAILKKSWAEFQNLYHVYHEVFASFGEK